MQTEQTSKEQTNYWNETNTFRDECQYLFSKSPYFTTKIELKFYEQSFSAESDYKVPPPSQIPERKKGDIEFFSKHSRTRLIKYFSQIQLSNYHKINFCTLTWHNDYPKDNFALKKFLDKFLKRLNYHYPNMDWIWRFEMQLRGAPHLHFIFLQKKEMKGTSYEKTRRNIRKIFYSLKECTCNHCLNYGFDYIELETVTKCFAYISKYVAKENEECNVKYSGRRWGSKTSIVTNPIETISLRGYQFVYLKKLLRDFYRSNAGKFNYINDNVEGCDSWFLICSTFDIRNIILNVLNTDLSVVFHSLKKEGFIREKEILDTENIAIDNYLINDN